MSLQRWFISVLVVLVVVFSIYTEIRIPAKTFTNSKDGIFTGKNWLGKKFTMSYKEYGDSKGYPILTLHPDPGSRLLINPSKIPKNIRVIALDRPGIGLSSASYHKIGFKNWVMEVRQLLDFLKIDKFSVVGCSAGGPYALAVAAFMPKRVEKVGLVGAVLSLKGVGNSGISKSVITHGMKRKNQIMYKIGEYAPWLMSILFKSLQDVIISSSREQIDEILNDDELLTGEEREIFLVSSAEVYRNGVFGLLDDLIRIHNPWDFKLSEIKQKVEIWQGSKDTSVSKNMAQYYGEHLENSSLEYVEDYGHFSLYLLKFDVILNSILGEHWKIA